MGRLKIEVTNQLRNILRSHIHKLTPNLSAFTNILLLGQAAICWQ